MVPANVFLSIGFTKVTSSVLVVERRFGSLGTVKIYFSSPIRVSKVRGRDIDPC
jgi:hypothetical protein